MSKEKIKVIIKGTMLDGSPERIITRIKGDPTDAVFFVSETLIRWSIDCGVRKSDLLNYIKDSYESVLKEREEDK